MIDITVSIDIGAPVAVVWRDIADLRSHTEWMAEAASIEFLTDRREGAGTMMRVMTRVGPLHTADVIEVTRWDPPFVIEVAHRGAIDGTGRFTITSVDPGCRFTWSETLSFPWWLGGSLAGLAARPILTTIWRRNLERFKDRF